MKGTANIRATIRDVSANVVFTQAEYEMLREGMHLAMLALHFVCRAAPGYTAPMPEIPEGVIDFKHATGQLGKAYKMVKQKGGFK